MEKKRLADHVQQIYVPDRKAWRDWLSKNHDSEKSIWLVYDKVSQGGKLTYEDIVEEGLCFGWIDSLVRTKDLKQTMQYVSQRKKGGTWSKVNKGRIPKLIISGLMTRPGLVVIDEAKKDGSWSSLDDIDNLVIHPDLQKALDKNKTATENFENFSASNRKQMLYRIYSAKQEETRRRRISQLIENLEQNI